MKPLKYLIFLVLVCNTVMAQRLSLDFDSNIPKTKPSQLDIKGEITDLIWATYSPDPLQGMFSNATEIYKFENNLVKSRYSIDWGEAYTYAYNNGVLQSESWAGSGSGYSLYKRNGNILSIFNNQNLDKPSAVITYDDYDRVVKVEKGTSVFEISYIDNSKNSKIKEKTEKIFMQDNRYKVKIMHKTTNTYYSKVWNNIQVNVQNSAQTTQNIASNSTRKTTTESYFDESERLVYSKWFKEDGTIIEESEYFYKDDVNGNWVTKTHFNKILNSIVFIEQRNITYANGLVSGRGEIKKEFVKELTIPQIRNKYSYKIINEKGQFSLLDPAGISIGWRAKHLGYNKTDNYYLIDTDINAIIELTNFKNAPIKTNIEAKIISKGYSDFYYANSGGDIIWINNNLIKKYEYTDTNKDTFILYDKDGDKSYTFSFPNNASIGAVIPIDSLPQAKNNAYWIPIETPNKMRFIFLIEKGINILSTEENTVISQKGIYVKANVGFYLIENLLGSKLWSINIPKVISENEFNKAKEAYEKLINIETTNKVLAKNNTTKPAIKNEKPDSNFGCGTNDGNCLVNYFNSKIVGLINQGKTKDEASRLAGVDLEQVFKGNPELGYFVVMKINQDYLIGLMGGLSAESRAQMRAMAMKEVKAYEDKYGSPKIKTVPYKPKKDNNN